MNRFEILLISGQLSMYRLLTAIRCMFSGSDASDFDVTAPSIVCGDMTKTSEPNFTKAVPDAARSQRWKELEQTIKECETWLETNKEPITENQQAIDDFKQYIANPIDHSIAQYQNPHLIDRNPNTHSYQRHKLAATRYELLNHQYMVSLERFAEDTGRLIIADGSRRVAKIELDLLTIVSCPNRDGAEESARYVKDRMIFETWYQEMEMAKGIEQLSLE